MIAIQIGDRAVETQTPRGCLEILMILYSSQPLAQSGSPQNEMAFKYIKRIALKWVKWGFEIAKPGSGKWPVPLAHHSPAKRCIACSTAAESAFLAADYFAPP